MIKSIIFDVDRTLVNSNKPEYNLFIKAYLKLTGKNVPQNVLSNLSNNTTEKTYSLLNLNDGDIKLLNHYWSIYLKEEKIDFFPGIEDLLVKLKEKGFILGILTSRSMYELHELDDILLRYMHLFSVVITVDKVELPKPSPCGLNIICNDLELEKDEILYVGDHYNDKLCAINAGVHFGYAKRDTDLPIMEAEYTFTEPNDLLIQL